MLDILDREGVHSTVAGNTRVSLRLSGHELGKQLVGVSISSPVICM